MNISKLKALWALATGGWAGLATYILEAVNAALKKLDQTKLAQMAQVVGCVLAALKALSPLLPAKYAKACAATIEAVDELAQALADGKVTEEELDAIVDGIEAAIVAWKEAR